MSNELDEFGELLIKEVRDAAIHTVKELLSGTLKSETAGPLEARLAEIDDREALEEFGVNIVNEVVFKILFFFAENEKYRLVAPSGRNIAEMSDGLHGEIFTEYGWIARYSDDKRGM